MTDPDCLLELGNDHLAFRWNADASGALTDRATGAVWRMASIAFQERGRVREDHCWHRSDRVIPEQYPGRFCGTREGDDVRFRLLGQMGEERGSFACSARLDGPWLEVRVDEIDDDLPSLIFPPPLEAESLVIPRGVGQWLREPVRDPRFYVLYSQLTMNWFGGLRGDDGWLCVLAKGWADAGLGIKGLCASPGWTRSMGRWSGPRAVRYRLTHDGWVGMAKAYRGWAAENGLVRTLREKMDDVPRVRSLVGGPMLSIYQARPIRRGVPEGWGRPVPPEVAENEGGVSVDVTHADAAAIVRDARGLGMERGIVNVRGWIKGGYDDSHPDVWPPEPALGTVDELRQLLAQDGDVATVLHDNYLDMYAQTASFPRGIARDSKGEYLPGGLWAGGQAWVVCPQVANDYARRNWKQIRTLDPDGMFIDTTACQELRECYDMEHPVSRDDDERLKVELLTFYREQGLLVGSEEVSSFCAPLVDWFESRHRHEPGVSIPLWPLVFHDCAVCYRYGRRDWLADVLWGYSLLWVARGRGHWDALRGEFVARRDVQDWHRRVALDEMVGHAYIGDDFLVERTEFSSGAAVVCNFASEPRTVDGTTVPAGGYVTVG